MAADDLAGLFADPPPGPSMDLRYRQGVVVAFDPVTLSNTVDVGGTLLTDLALLGLGEATLLTPGSVVGIVAITAAKGAATWAIIGRLVQPQTTEATSAITQLAQNVVSSQVNTVQGTASTTYVELDGPSVAIRVGASGSILVVLSAEVQSDAEICLMSFDVSGSNVRAPDDGSALYVYVEGTYAALTASRVVHLSGLQPGPIIVTAQYRVEAVGVSALWANRSITVFAL